ncbi:MAG: amidohydrolase family protein [Planctomycetota bacterium]
MISNRIATLLPSNRRNRIPSTLMNRPSHTSLRRSLVPAFTAGLLTAGLFAFGQSSLAAQELLAVRGGTVHTMKDGVMENATILIEDGVITAIGTEVEVPWNATVVDAEGKIVLPSYVLAHSSGGMGGQNERMANVPFLTVEDALDPSSQYFEDGRRNGIGTMHIIPGNRTLIGGQGMIVRPFGKTVEDMALATRTGLKMSLQASGGSRLQQIRGMRNALRDAARAQDELARKRELFEQEQAAGAIPEDQEFEEELDERQAPVAKLLNGELRGFLYVPGAPEVAEVEQMKADYPVLDLALIVGPRCYKAADRLAALGFPVILDSSALEYTETDPLTDEDTLICPAKVFSDAGIDFALSLSSGITGASRYPWWQMAVMVRHGVGRDQALRSLTTRPAEILGLDDRIGSLAEGMTANVQILTGDPLSATTWVDTLVLDGEVVYRRSEDRRLKILFGENDDAEASNEGGE